MIDASHHETMTLAAAQNSQASTMSCVIHQLLRTFVHFLDNTYRHIGSVIIAVGLKPELA